MSRIPDEASNSPMSDNIIATPALPAKATSRSDVAGRVVSNVILLSLPEKEYEMLAPHVEHLHLPQRLERATFRAIMQMQGSGFRVRSEVFLDVLLRASSLRSELSRFGLVHGMQVAQLVACNRLHEINQRLARCLLMCQDRFDSQLLPLTHEFLAQMLGTGRPSVSLAAGALEAAGLIENLRGTVKILNRKDLEETACECYGIIQDFNVGLGLK